MITRFTFGAEDVIEYWGDVQIVRHAGIEGTAPADAVLHTYRITGQQWTRILFAPIGPASYQRHLAYLGGQTLPVCVHVLTTRADGTTIITEHTGVGTYFDGQRPEILIPDQMTRRVLDSPALVTIGA